MAIMVDLETFGTTPESAFFSIGACRFNIKDGVRERYYRAIKFDEAVKGRAVLGGTLRWWLEQDRDAQMAAVMCDDKGTNMVQALGGLSAFIKEDEEVWSNGATFDIAMLENAYRQYGMEPPWKFWNVRDCRTIESLARVIGVTRKDFDRKGVHHNAVDDAVYQAEYIVGMTKALLQQRKA